jgi:tetratricopeptide (TPR) repeat protein
MYRLMIVQMIMGLGELHAAEVGPTYVPLSEGSSWTYQDARRSGEREEKSKHVLEIKKTAEIAGQKAAVMDVVAMVAKDDGVWAIGVVAPQSGTDQIVPLKEPYKVLPLRPKAGDKWQHTDDRGATNTTVLGNEKVKTEAGEFDAVKVYSITVGGKDGSQRSEDYRWYAPGVGLVKSTSTARRLVDGKLVTEEFARELLAYDIPREGAAATRRPAEGAMDEDSVAALFGEGEALARKGDHAGAIAKYDAALAKDPRAAKLHAYKAVSLIATRKYDEAQRSIDAALALNDREHTYHEIAGQLKLAQSRVDEGLKLYDRAAALSPKSAGAVYTDLAAVLAAKNDPKLAPEIDRALKRAADADPPSLEALFALGQSYVNAGRAEGKTYLRRYIDLATALPPDKRDETKIRLAKQLIRALDAIKGG